MATVYRMVKETVEGKTRWVRRRDAGPGTWFLAYCRDGKQMKEATDAQSKTEAQQLLKAKLSDNVKAKLMAVQAVSIDLTYSRFVQETFMPYVEQTRRTSTYKMYGQLARATEAALGTLKLREIRRGHIQQYIRDRKENGRTWKKKPLRPATINSEVGFIKSVFYDALGRELVERNPAARIEILDEKNTRERTISPAE